MSGNRSRNEAAAKSAPGTYMKNLLLSWQFWALLSAGFAALTAIFAKIGIENVNSDFATFIRTIIILLAAGLMVYITGHWQSPATITGRTWIFLVLSGLATGASWICYFRALKIGDAARVAPIDKLSVVFVAVFAVLFFRRATVSAKLDRCRFDCLRGGLGGLSRIASGVALIDAPVSPERHI